MGAQRAYKPRLVVTTGDPVVIARAPAVTRVLALGDQQYEECALTDYTEPGATTRHLNADVVGAAPGVCFYADVMSMTGS
jgi:hypothetical protein